MTHTEDEGQKYYFIVFNTVQNVFIAQMTKLQNDH